MANKIWDEPIDKYTNWGGDLSTLGLPVSGNRVQEFIKDSLNGKAGFFYRDAPNNRYLVFADRDNFEIWEDDPSREDLIMAAWEAPYNYTAQINLITPQDIIVSKDTLNNIISFTYTILNTNEQEVGDDVTCTYTFRNNDVEKSVSEKYVAGQTISFNADPYLKDGVNNIRIDLYGKTTYATTFITLSIRVINLELSDSFDISKPYTVGEEVPIRYTVTGTGLRCIEWYLDGVMHSVDELTGSSSTGSTKRLSTVNLLPGVHNVQFRAYTDVGGTLFYTDILYREFIIRDDSVHIATACTIPNSVGILANSANLQYYGAIQYVPYEIRYAVYNHDPVAITEVEIYVDNVLQSTVSTTNEVEYTYALLSKTDGQHIVKFVVGNLQRSVPANVELSSTGLQEYTDGLEFNFSAVGRSNSDRYKAPDEIDGKTVTFENFNWNITSGWINNNLVISSGTSNNSQGASLKFNYKPLNNQNLTLSGKTLEFEFATSNVSNDDAIVCDLRGSNGIGLLITATQAAYYYRTNAVPIYTRFKPEEILRVSFVITPYQSITDGDEPRLIKLYINGVLSGAVPYNQYESLRSDADLTFTGTNEAEILLKYVRIYNTALSNEQILNNYILYREDAHEMLTIFNRNDIKTDGSFDLNKMSAQLPVMIVTGDVDKLEATSDKDETITVDIDYTNLQDPTRSFRAVNAAMRPQGTSSMSYPKKNFRIYINRKGYPTVFYDSNGDVVDDNTYSFKAGAQKVSTWCLKADYAESSSSHNTGVARLWNKVMYDAVVTFGDTTNHEHDINEAHALRTIAQQTEYENNRKIGDVRTTVDGFPILLFKRKDYNSSLIFIGKYNFNNDKSTVSVYGFDKIPNFDSSKVQCVEVKQNSHPYALFQTTEGFNDRREVVDQNHIYKWQDAFEYRYPDLDDDSQSDTTALKTFADWMVEVNGNRERFALEKWDHFDVYKIAAYYVYLMRFGAVDQFVKNAMFTTEDGVHWFYINYDNDTILGLRNDGMLLYGPTIDRNTSASGVQVMDDDGETSVWAYAGHDSNLWNMLEADDEFMRIVPVVDNALYAAGLTYEDTIAMFNTEQSDKWCETVFNEDAKYKYIDPWFDNGTKRLYMLQGKRDAHRKWWLSHRFILYDSIFVSGAYRRKYFEFKTNGAAVGTEFSIKAGYNLEYGYGVNTAIYPHIIPDENNRCTFTLTSPVNIGDPIRIFAAPLIEEIDIHNFIEYLTEIALDNVYDESLGTKLKKLVLGVDLDNDSRRNPSNVFSISGLEKASKLEWLDVRGYSGLTALDVSKLTRLKTLLAYGTSLSGVSIAPGALIENLYLPQTLEALILEDLAYLNYYGLHLEEYGKNIKTIIIRNCPNLTVTPDLLFNWRTARNLVVPAEYDNEASVTVTNISWGNVDPDDLISFGQFALGQFEPGATRRLNLSGIIRLNRLDSERGQTQAEMLVDIFGPDAFTIGNSLYIVAPKAIYLTAPSGDIVEGGTYRFTATVFDPDAVTPGTITYHVSPESEGTQIIDSQTGELTTFELGSGTNRNVLVWAEYTPYGQVGRERAELNVAINARTYPTSVSINGNAIVTDETRYEAVFSNEVTGTLTYEWSISGSITDYVEISQGATSKICYLRKTTDDDTIDADGVLTVTVRRANSPNTQPKTAEIQINIASEEVVMTVYSNPEVFRCLYERGLTDNNPTILTKSQALSIRDSDLIWSGTENKSIFTYDRNLNSRNIIKAFPEFKEFTRVESIPANLFYGCTMLTNIELPDSIVEIGAGAFTLCNKLSNIVLPIGLLTIGAGAFRSCTNLTKVSTKGSLSESNFELPSGITSIPDNCFWESGIIEVNLTGITSIGQYAFYHTKINTVTIPNTVTTIGARAFQECQQLTNATIYSSYVSDYMMYKCQQLVSVTINSSGNIGNYAFWDCINLATVTLSNITSIGADAFYNCTALTNITIPSSVTTIGGSAFAFTGLTSFVFDSNLQSINTNVLNNCSLNAVIWNTSNSQLGALNNCTIQTLYLNSNIVGSTAAMQNNNVINLVVGSNVTSIPDGITQQFSQLLTNTETITVSPSNSTFHSEGNCLMEGTILRFGIKTSVIPNNTTSISQMAFRDKDIQSIAIPNTTTVIGSNAFYNCASLTTIIFAQNSTLTTIEAFAFGKCVNLTTIALPESLLTLGQNVFAESGLITLTIPNNVTSIGGNICRNCPNFTSIFIGRSVSGIVNPGSTDQYGFGTSPITSIKVDDANVNYSDRNCNGVFSKNGATIYLSCNSTILPSDTRDISAGCFQRRTLTNSPDLSNITSIGNRAFQYTSGLTNIVLHDNIGLGEYIFASSSIQSISIGSINYGGDRLCSSCQSLTSITFRDSCTSIPSNICNGCRSLTTIVWPINNLITSIGNYAFEQCESLTSITIPNGITSIGTGAFRYCTGLVSISIPNGVTSIPSSLCSNCTSLEEVTLLDTSYDQTMLNQACFENCYKLQTIIIYNLKAPVFYAMSGITSFSNAGKNAVGSKILYVPTNATLYDVGYWSSNVLSPSGLGFQLSKTL